MIKFGIDKWAHYMLDNAKYQKWILVAELATHLKILLLYLQSYSPNLNSIERLWKYVKKSCLNVNIMKIYPYLQPVFLNV